ncbi:MAG: twin-arginine translocation signal domain-containing protein [Verrucomicrobiota bacterium]|nr:twin-arginine translocation signal domain-containing protein [Verrucomicrobiota bacterium]
MPPHPDDLTRREALKLTAAGLGALAVASGIVSAQIPWPRSRRLS